MGTPDKSIPQDLLDKSNCIVLVPGLKKAAFVVGGKYGRGFAVCRQAGGPGWGPPAAMRIEGGSVGFQIGVSSSDVILLVMNESGMKKLSSSKFTIGADATAAAGPVGRNATAQTDAFMTAEILSWSRSEGSVRGNFAGWRYPAQRSGRERGPVQPALDQQTDSRQRSKDARAGI